MNLERWTGLMKVWGFDRNERTYGSLAAAYAEKHRHYHTAEHINACLRHLETFSTQLDYPHEVELALWFHDAVYNPLSAKNELMSADWACSFLSDSSAESDAITRVHRLIMVTKHDARTDTRDESILVDIDLSILGADVVTYDSFERTVREEYKVVPAFLYRKKRAEILSGFLERPHIYTNEPFATLREQQARINLSEAIKSLVGRG